jgi:hypothetical protein|tara:strand:- start:3214 stop:3393 length:180 start_codon:yes stop_codon:yes gene_type:complete
VLPIKIVISGLEIGMFERSEFFDFPEITIFIGKPQASTRGALGLLGNWARNSLTRNHAK